MSLPQDYTAEVDNVDKNEWHRILSRFDDANLYQTWSYGLGRWKKSTLSHLLLKKNGEIVSVVQVGITRIPLLGGVAYIRWGPLWKRKETPFDIENLRLMLQCLRSEYVQRQGLLLRIVPKETEREKEVTELFESEGFLRKERPGRTFIIDISPPLEELRRALVPRWRTDLNRSEKNDLELIQGTGQNLYEEFSEMYWEMFKRKGLAEFGDYSDFKKIQKQLPEPYKLNIMLCRSNGESIAGAITSAIGETGLAILWATNLKGREMKGAYFLQWNVIKWLKDQGCRYYDLGGVSKENNPGGYRFKSGLAGKQSEEISFLGQFDACDSILSSCVVYAGDRFRSAYQGAKVGISRLFNNEKQNDG